MILFKVLILFLTLVNFSLSDDRCPDAKEIDPCHCDLEGISCFTIKTEEEFLRVFKAKSSVKAARAFWLNGTPLKVIPKGSFNNYKFQNVYLDKNLIEKIESGFLTGSEETLTSLSVYDNHLKEFPFQDLKNFPKLDSLSLASNYLSNIPDDALRGSSLQSIVLRNNQITSIGKNAFYDMERLESLDLSHSNLQTLQANSFSISSPGVAISLADNKISSIEKDAFLWTNLLQLDLSGNALKSLPPTTFYPVFKSLLANHGAMLCGDNPFNCKGCEDWKWIAQNARVLSRMLIEFECSNGGSVFDLFSEMIDC